MQINYTARRDNTSAAWTFYFCFCCLIFRNTLRTNLWSTKELNHTHLDFYLIWIQNKITSFSSVGFEQLYYFHIYITLKEFPSTLYLSMKESYIVLLNSMAKP